MGNKDSQIEWRSQCPISSALDVIGDKWSLLVIRDLIIHGERTYSQLLDSAEHISTNILASRLELLTFFKVIERTNPVGSRNNAFKLTKAGLALKPAIESLAKWSGKYLQEFHENIVQLR